MKPKLNWTTLLVSNALLTVPVTFTFGVLGFLLGDLLNLLAHDGNLHLLPEYLRQEEALRGVCIAAMLLAGFATSQICFVVRVIREDTAPLWSLRFRLLTSLILMLAAAGFLYLNVRTVVLQDQTNYTMVRYGWPFQYLRESTWTGSAPEQYWFHFNFGLNFLFCGDLLLVIMVVIEFFLSRRKTAEMSAPKLSVVSIENGSLPNLANVRV